MHREFIYTPTFDKRWERLKLSDTDLRELAQLLLEDPERTWRHGNRDRRH